MPGEGDLDPKPCVDSVGTDMMLIIFLALFFLLDAVWAPRTTDFIPLSLTDLRLFPAFTGRYRSRPQGPPGVKPRRECLDSSLRSLV